MKFLHQTSAPSTPKVSFPQEKKPEVRIAALGRDQEAAS
jgi:hypothetical protein